MRYVSSICWVGFGLVALSCDDGGLSSSSSCPPGQERCGSVCCTANLGGSRSSSTTGTTRPPVDPGPYSSPDCTDSSTTSGTLRSDFGGINLSASDGKQYYLAPNWWGKYDGQTIAYQGLSFTVGNPNGVEADGNNPIGYPTMFIGTYSGHATAENNLPKQVSSLITVPTVFSTNAADGARDHYNAAYDVWFTPTGDKLGSTASSPPPGGAYLMVWLFKPTERQPRGNKRTSAHAVEGVENSWNVWIDSASDPLCISYVATTEVNGLAFDLNYFIQDSVKNNYGITSSMYLSVIFAGFEIWAGGDGLQVKNFCAKVN